MTTILVIEDHPIFLRYLTLMLEQVGEYTVLSAGDAEGGLDCLRKGPVDLALIDVSLPGKDGIWLLNAIRTFNPDLPCLMLSGYATRQYVEQSMEAGARGYVLKDDVPGILEGIRVAMSGGTFISEGSMAH